MLNLSRIKLVLILFCVCAFTVNAQETSDAEAGTDQAAADAVNPLAFITKLQFQPNYTFFDNGGEQLNLVSRIMQPSASIGLPFVKSKVPKKVYTIYRVEVPIIGQTISESNPLNATGIGDIVIVDAICFKQQWGIAGIGPALMIPTASADALGTGKWSAGPVAVVLYTKVPKMQIGLLAQQFTSFAGDNNRGDTNLMLFQPIVNKILTKGYFLQFNPIMQFDWENKKYNIPIALSIGRAFAKNLSVFIAPEYVVSGPAKGNFTLRLNINTMFASIN